MSRKAEYDDPDAPVSAVEAARLLGVSRRTVYDLVERRELPHFRVGGLIRFRRATLLTWIDRQEETSTNAAVPEKRPVVHELPRGGPRDGSPPPLSPVA